MSAARLLLLIAVSCSSPARPPAKVEPPAPQGPTAGEGGAGGAIGRWESVEEAGERKLEGAAVPQRGS
jgi:hypothetical protein